jgi:FAD/FMN-containing dehydrogenase
MHAIPFPPMSGLLTPSGKRMNWLHTAVPNSLGGECFTATEAVFRRNESLMKQHGIDRGYLLSTHGPTAVGVETLIRWSDAPYPIHTHFLSAEEKRRLKTRAANPSAAQAVQALSAEILAAWKALGGVHLQIGRKYPFLETRLPETADLLRALRHTLDPDAVINPGNVFPHDSE